GIELADCDSQPVDGPRIHGLGLARHALGRQSPHSGGQISPKRSASASSQAAAAMRSASPTAAEPISLIRPIWGSIARLTRSASFSIAVFNSSTTRTRATTAMSARRFQAGSATRKATGTARTTAISSRRNASSLRAAARRPRQVLIVARSKRSMERRHSIGDSARSNPRKRQGRCLLRRARGLRTARMGPPPSSCHQHGRTLARTVPDELVLRLRRADGGRAATDLDRSGRLELLAVEAKHHDLFLDHALGQERATVLAPGEALTPVAGLRLRHRDQFIAFDAEYFDQTVIVEERTVFRLVRSVPHVQSKKGAVGGKRDPFRRLTDRDG